MPSADFGIPFLSFFLVIFDLNFPETSYLGGDFIDLHLKKIEGTLRQTLWYNWRYPINWKMTSIQRPKNGQKKNNNKIPKELWSDIFSLQLLLFYPKGNLVSVGCAFTYLFIFHNNPLPIERWIIRDTFPILVT